MMLTVRLDGSFYMFLEASTNGSTGQIGNNATAILESPCIDLGGQGSASFSFGYHMYGTNMGTLVLEVSTNGGSSWSSIWSESGNQGNSWLSTSVSLNAYAGSTINLRFRGTTGNSWRSDMAIDNLSITAVGTSSNYEITTDDVQSAFEVEIFPNPVTGNVLNVNSNHDAVSFSIIGMAGQQVARGIIENNQINVGSLAKGVYLIQLTSGTENESIRFIKK